MKLTLIVANFPPKLGGIATYNHDLVRALAADPAITKLRLIIWSSGTYASTGFGPKVSVEVLPRRNMFRLVFDLLRIMRADDADVFHITTLFPIGAVAVFVGKLLNKKTVLTVYGTDVLTRKGKRLTRLLKEFALRRANRVLAISKSTTSLAVKNFGVPEAHIGLAQYPLPPLTVKTAPKEMAQQVMVLNCSALVPRKGTEYILRALAAVPKRNVTLTIVGDGPERARLESIAHELGITDRVTFAGAVENVHAYYERADMFVLASYVDEEAGDIEGLGIVMLEAAQHGLPVIGTRSGGIPETFLPNESGILVEEKDVAGLARAIETLADDPELRRRMGKRGQEFVAAHFAPSTVAAEYVREYEAVARR